VARFTQVETYTFNDEHYVTLSERARLFFLWSWCNDRAGISALYAVSMRQLCRAFAEPRNPEHIEALTAAVEVALDELADVAPTMKPMVRYDHVNEVLWVPSRAGKANKSPLTQKGIINEYHRCPGSPLKTEFAARYPEILGDAA
jgi:hypothetical protein